MIAAIFTLLVAQDARDEVLKLLEQKPQRTDMVILIDTSGSMHKHFEATRVFAGQLAKLARPGDTVTLISMAERAAELPASTKLAPPKGRYTDLGAGLYAITDALLRPGYAPISLVFLVTDFCAEPPPGSPYAGTIEGAGPCQTVTSPETLKKRSAQLFSSGDQQIRVVALALEPVSEAGLSAAREVLGSLVRVDVVGGELERALGNMRVRLAYDRAALEVEKILRAPPLAFKEDRLALPISGAIRNSLTILATSPLPLTTEIHSVRALDDSLRFEADTVANVPGKARPWSLDQPTREVEIEAKVRFSIEPRAGVEKLIGREPKGEVFVRKRIILDLSPSAGPSLAISAPAAIEIAPGESAPVSIEFRNTLEWAKVEAACTLNGVAQPPMTIAPAATSVIVSPLANSSATSAFKLREEHRAPIPWRASCAIAAITADGKRVERGTEALEATTELTWMDGTSPWTIALVLVLSALAAILYVREVRPRMEPAALRGRLVVYDGPGDFRRITVPLKGRQRFDLDGVESAGESAPRIDADRVVLPGPSDTSAQLYAEKSGKRTVMRLRKTRGDRVKIGETEVGPQPVVIKRGNARFSIGEYHCRID